MQADQKSMNATSTATWLWVFSHYVGGKDPIDDTIVLGSHGGTIFILRRGLRLIFVLPSKAACAIYKARSCEIVSNSSRKCKNIKNHLNLGIPSSETNLFERMYFVQPAVFPCYRVSEDTPCCRFKSNTFHGNGACFKKKLKTRFTIYNHDNLNDCSK